MTGTNVEENTKVALVQVSTHEKVYLIDMVKLSILLDQTDCEIFVKKFITNRKIIKIGYGFTQDLKMIAKSFGDTRDTDTFRQSVIDLAYLVNQVSFTFHIKTIYLLNVILDIFFKLAFGIKFSIIYRNEQNAINRIERKRARSQRIGEIMLRQAIEQIRANV